MSDLRLLDDNPAEADLLGFTRMQDILERVVRNPPKRPFTLGIFGEWGSGKTTLMKLIQRRLEDEGHAHDNAAIGESAPGSAVKTVWFNAWKYDSKEIIWNALIQTIFLRMHEDPAIAHGRDVNEFREKVGRAAKGLATYAAKVGTRLIPGGLVREEDVDQLVASLSSDATDPEFAFINRFEQAFDELVAEYVGEEGHIVVFVDDLDRCLPENAINVMEALKLYLDRANCVFVIGAESEIVEEGIRQRYKSNRRLNAEDYLDKIIQLPFALPQIDEENAMRLLGQHGELPVHRDERMKTMLVVGTGGNPRRVKRFVNAFSVLRSVSAEEPLEGQLRLAKVLMLQMRFPKLFHQLPDDLNLAQWLTESLMAERDDRERRRDGSPERVREFFDDADLTRFLLKTSEITMKPDEIRRWVILTNVHAPLAG